MKQAIPDEDRCVFIVSFKLLVVELKAKTCMPCSCLSPAAVVVWERYRIYVLTSQKRLK